MTDNSVAITAPPARCRLLPRHGAALAGIAVALLLSVSLVGRPAQAQRSAEVEQLWTAHAELTAQFEELRREAEEADLLTAPGHRAYREAIAVGRELIDVLGDILQRDQTLTEEERQVGVDTLLTVRQVVGSLLVELGDCEEAVSTLDAVLNHPGIDEVGREIIEERALLWSDRAEACIREERQVAADTAPEPPGREQRPASDAATTAAEGTAERSMSADEVPGTAVLTDEVEDQRGGNVGGWVLFGSGAATATVGGIIALTRGEDVLEYDRARAACISSSGCSDSEFADLEAQHADLSRARAITIALLAGGGAMMVGGLLWATVGGDEDDAREASSAHRLVRVRTEPWIGRSAGGIQVWGSW